ncbi:hypothetical protein B0J15DRAFT_592330 [Fusarium solani]|uniref:MYND-type domain-containing protein n=1 Tax=Fusarium solani TaxID=169388 RepID=A0A9P9KNN8_FUSSL|nr:uncharacterized protein B0J15DRAFT_592330 [Fusarium solani]KAH7265785.1 hypothetical protein B0J15DRAFT_592330 [Fusarium solani]
MSSSDPCKLLPRACGVCGKKEDLLRCSGCQVVYYCGRPSKISTEVFTRQGVRNDGSVPDDLFVEGIGYFGAIPLTEPYTLARYQLAKTLLLCFGGASGLVDAVQTALDQLLDIFWLNRGDRKDWCATTGNPVHFEWDDWTHYGWDIELPFCKVEGADALEPPGNWASERRSEISPIVALTIIKVQILLDLLAVLNTTRALQGSVPEEIIGLIREQLVGGTVQSRPEILRAGAEEMARCVEMIKAQITDLYNLVSTYNPHVWRLMLNDPHAAAASGPFSYPLNSEEEAYLVIGESLASWLETPGSFDMMRYVSQTA